MPSLEEPLVKLEWADKHLKRLQAEGADFMASKPYAVVGKKNPQLSVEVSHDWSDLHLKILKPLPPDFVLLLGDFVQNLRTSLDYLVWQLSLITKPNLDTLPSDPRLVTDIEFPIFLVDNDASINKRLKFVPQKAAKEIKNLQPHHRGNRAHEDWLAVLHSLSNRDKHRQLTPIGLIVRTDFTLFGRHIGGLNEKSIPLEDGAVITQLPTGAVTQAERNFQVRGTPEILLDKGGPPGGVRLESLNHLNDYIRDVVFPKFSCFFS